MYNLKENLRLHGAQEDLSTRKCRLKKHTSKHTHS